jgi:hypothetical protein
MNPQTIYHAYAMTYLELDRARSERKPVPNSVLVRLAGCEVHVQRAVMRALRDVERVHPIRPKNELLTLVERTTAPCSA